MKNNNNPTKTDLKALDKIKDQDIDYSDIPELDNEFFKNSTLVQPPHKQNLAILDGFAVNIFEYTNGDWIAHFTELPNVSACGDTPEEAYSELVTAWQLMKKSYAARNESIPVALLESIPDRKK